MTITVSLPGWIEAGIARAWIATEGDRLVGVIALTADALEPTIGLSQVLAVVPDRRRRYVGYTLKATALDWFRDHGGTVVYSEVDEANVAMLGCNALFGAVVDPADEAGLLDVVVRVAD